MQRDGRTTSEEWNFSVHSVGSALMQCLLTLDSVIADLTSWWSRQSPTHRLGHELVWGLFQAAAIRQFIEPEFRFKFLFFEWVEPWCGEYIYGVFALVGLCSVRGDFTYPLLEMT